MKNFIDAIQSKTYTYDEGLRAYMGNVYKYMSLALLVTGLVSFIVAHSTTLMKIIFGTPLSFIVAIAPLIYVFYFGRKIWTISPERARNNLLIFSGLMGLSLTSVFLMYTYISIVRVFFITSAMFAGMSLYGYTTKRDLRPMAQFLFMGLIGIIIASLVNIFLKSSSVDFSVSVLSVVIFAGLTTYDIQTIKDTYSYIGVNSDSNDKVAIIGALNLYMDFINLFIALLRLFGDNKN